jgi:hypothetical protein
MQKTWFNNFALTISMLLVIPQFALYLVGVAAADGKRVFQTSWYGFTAFTGTGGYNFFLGLRGYLVETPTTRVYTDYNTQRLSFSAACRTTGRNDLILASLAVAFSFALFLTLAARMGKQDESYGDILTSFLLALISFGLGLGSYVNFVNDCANTFSSYLSGNGFSNVIGTINPGGACMVTAIILNFLIGSLHLNELGGTALIDAAARRQGNIQ